MNGTQRFAVWVFTAAALAGVRTDAAERPPGVPAPDGPKVPPAKAVPALPKDGEIAAWVRDLGADDYRERERAGQRLFGVGIHARPHLLPAAADRDPEVAHRARRLLAELSWHLAGDHEEVQGLLKDYNLAQPATRSDIVLQLVRRGDRLGWPVVVPALLRLLRYEDSDEIRREVLTRLLLWDTPEVRKAVEPLLPAPPTTAADFALVALMRRDEPVVALEAWTKAVAVERARIDLPRLVTPGFLRLLLARQAAAAEFADKLPDAGAARAALARLDKTDADAVTGLIDWLVLQGDRAGLAAAETEFAAVADADPRCLLLRARAAETAGRKDEGDALLARVRELTKEDPVLRYSLAEFLLLRGWAAAAEPLLATLPDAAPADEVYDIALNARLRLAEIAAGKGRPAVAAEHLAKVVDLLEARLKSGSGVYYFKSVAGLQGPELLEAMQARLAAARLLAAEGTPGAEAALTALRKIAKADVESALTLVAALRKRSRAADLAAVVAETRARTLALYERYPDPAHLASTAWLMAKAGVGLPEARTLADRAVRAQPDRADWWDTLAEVRRAAGDKVGAVSAQRRAVDLEPFCADYRSRLAGK